MDIIKRTYCDNTGKEPDIYDFKVYDISNIKKGNIFSPSFKDRDGDILKAGSFKVDNIEETDRDEFIIKCSSIISRRAICEKRTRAWEKTTLKRLIEEIANSLSMKGFLYEGSDIKLERVEQKNESDMVFINRLCHEYGLIMKNNSEKLIVMCPGKIESQKAKLTLYKSDTEKNTLKDETRYLYGSCELKYFNPKLKKEICGRYAPGVYPSEKILQLNTEVETEEEANDLCMRVLKRKNRYMISGDIYLEGHTHLLATQNIMLKGFGFFDGKYHIDKAIHSEDSTNGYKTKITVRRCNE